MASQYLERVKNNSRIFYNPSLIILTSFIVNDALAQAQWAEKVCR